MFILIHWDLLSLCLSWYTGIYWACVYPGTLGFIEPVFILVHWDLLSLCLSWYTGIDWSCVYTGALELIEPVFILMHWNYLSPCLYWYTGIDWACVYSGTLELIEPVFMHCNWLSLCLYTYMGVTTSIHRSSSVKVDTAIPTQDSSSSSSVSNCRQVPYITVCRWQKGKKASAYGRNLKDATCRLMLHAPVTSLFRIFECSPG